MPVVPPVPVGTIVEQCRVIRIDATHGVLLFLPALDIEGFVHVSNTVDDKADRVNTKRFEMGSTHRARVLGTVVMDGVLNLSVAPAALAEQFLDFDVCQTSLWIGIRWDGDRCAPDSLPWCLSAVRRCRLVKSCLAR